MTADSRWRIAIIDSGLNPGAGLAVEASARFEATDQGVRRSESVADPHGHGTRVAQVIASSPNPVRLLIAQALDERGVSSAAAVAAAIDWAVSQSAHLLHLSVGLSQDREVLSTAVANAVAAGVLVVASCPARGAVSFPAAYGGVLRASGDARCATDQISYLAAEYAEFGGCVRLPGEERARGASIGAAHVTRFISAQTPAGASPSAVRERLIALAAYHGRERR